MIKDLSFTEFANLAQTSDKVAVFKQFRTNDLSALHIYEVLIENGFQGGILLEDLQQRDGFINSYLGFNPVETFSINENHKNFLTEVHQIQNKLKFAVREDVVNLITSAAGFISYDAVRFFEEIPDRHPPDNFPLVFFKFFSVSLTFNQRDKTVLVSIIVDVKKDTLNESYNQATAKLGEIGKLLNQYKFEEYVAPETTNSATQITVDCSDEEFMAMVDKAKDYIVKGDAFQIVLSRSFQRHISKSPLEIYKALRYISPAPFLFYIPVSSNETIIGASPERFIQVMDRTITANPIAGTRARKIDKGDEVKQELLTDEKELAEHMMLVDLTRNDVGSVSEPASVRVKELLNVQHYSHVTHITSTITGVLRQNLSPLDAIKSAFPVGTLSGAPKIRAMEIIDELEQSRRGLYGGAILRMDGVFDVDSAVAIRMAHIKDNTATVRTGAGIVYDSDPKKENKETYQKAAPIIKALYCAHGEEFNVTDN